MERNRDTCAIYCCSDDTSTLVSDIEDSLGIGVTTIAEDTHLKQLQIGDIGRELITNGASLGLVF